MAERPRCLTAGGVDTHKINFNGGDRHFSWADHEVDFTGQARDWAAFFRRYLQEYDIAAVFVYGDCRLYHAEARAVCQALDVPFGVFEEGYLRPDFVTLEWGGVNAFSETDWSHEAIRDYRPAGREPSLKVGLTFWQRAWFATRYYFAARLARSEFPAYQHHRNRDWKAEGWCWLKSFFRKGLYKVTQRSILSDIVDRYDGRFYLFPLQTCDDFQLRTHSDLLSIENAIDVVISSFAEHASKGEALVIKHHPMDRGFCHYRKLIEALARQRGAAGRVFYCHDLHLPTMLEHARGVVTINSTVGISALLHRVPTKVLGRAFYDMAGLTHRGDLASFWRAADPVDMALFHRFRTYLYEHTQLDGSFFKHINLTVDAAWNRLMHVVPVRERVSIPAESVSAIDAS